MPEEQQERFPQASFYEHVCRCVVCSLFFVVFYYVLLLYHAYAITYILYVAYSSSSSFVVRGSEQPGRDTENIYQYLIHFFIISIEGARLTCGGSSLSGLLGLFSARNFAKIGLLISLPNQGWIINRWSIAC